MDPAAGTEALESFRLGRREFDPVVYAWRVCNPQTPVPAVLVYGLPAPLRPPASESAEQP